MRKKKEQEVINKTRTEISKKKRVKKIPKQGFFYNNIKI